MAQKKNKKNKKQNVNNVDVSENENEKPSKNSQKRAQRAIGKRVVYKRKAVERAAKQQLQNTVAQNDAPQVNNAINENIEVNVNIAQPQEKKNESAQNSRGLFGELPQQRNQKASILNDDYLRSGQRKIPGIGYVEPMKPKEEEKKPEQEASQSVPSSGMGIPGIKNNNSQVQAPLNQLTEEEWLTLRLKSEEYNLQNLRKQRVSSPQQFKKIQDQISQKEDEIDDIKLRLGLTTQEQIDARKKEAQLKEQERNKVELRNLERQLASFSEALENANGANKEWNEKNKKSIEKEVERLKKLVPENERLPINDEEEINLANEPVIVEGNQVENLDNNPKNQDEIINNEEKINDEPVPKIDENNNDNDINNDVIEENNNGDWLREREEDLARRAQEHQNRVNSGNVLNDIENKLENDRKAALSRVQENKEAELNSQKVDQIADDKYEAFQRAMEQVDARLNAAQERLDTLLKAQGGNVYERSLRNSQIEYLRDLIKDLNAVKNFGADVDEPAKEDQAQPEHNDVPNQNQPEANGEIRFFPEDNIKLTREDVKLKIAELNEQILTGEASVEGHNPRRFVSMDELKKEVNEEVPDGMFDGFDEMFAAVMNDSHKSVVFTSKLDSFAGMYKLNVDVKEFGEYVGKAWALMKTGKVQDLNSGKKMLGDFFKSTLKSVLDIEKNASYNEHRIPEFNEIIISTNELFRSAMYVFTDLYHDPKSEFLYDPTAFGGLNAKELAELTMGDSLWKMDQKSDEAWEIQSRSAKDLADQWLKENRPYEKMIDEMNKLIENTKKGSFDTRETYTKLIAAEWLLTNNEKMMIEDPEDPLNPIPNWGNRYWKTLTAAREAVGISKHTSMRELIQSDYAEMAKAVVSVKYNEQQIDEHILDPDVRELYDSYTNQMVEFATQSEANYISSPPKQNAEEKVAEEHENDIRWREPVESQNEREKMKREPKIFSNMVIEKENELKIDANR